MKRWGIILLILFGLMLAKGFLPEDLSFAACAVSGPCTPACNSNCTYYTCDAASVAGIHQIPTTIYDNSSCSGTGQTVSTLSFTDPGGTTQSSLPTPSIINAFACNQNIVNGSACCAPNCDCAANTSVGDNCENSCGTGTCAGTETCTWAYSASLQGNSLYSASCGPSWFNGIPGDEVYYCIVTFPETTIYGSGSGLEMTFDQDTGDITYISLITLNHDVCSAQVTQIVSASSPLAPGYSIGIPCLGVTLTNGSYSVESGAGTCDIGSGGVCLGHSCVCIGNDYNCGTYPNCGFMDSCGVCNGPNPVTCPSGYNGCSCASINQQVGNGLGGWCPVNCSGQCLNGVCNPSGCIGSSYNSNTGQCEPFCPQGYMYVGTGTGTGTCPAGYYMPSGGCPAGYYMPSGGCPAGYMYQGSCPAGYSCPSGSC